MSDEQPAPADEIEPGSYGGLLNARVRFWVCRQHRRGRVEWRGDVAHCLEDGCGRTSEQPDPTAREIPAGELTEARAQAEHDRASSVRNRRRVVDLREELTAAQAAIQRVRDLCAETEPNGYGGEPDLYAADVLLALDELGRERRAQEFAATYAADLAHVEQERDAARAEVERLRARVADLEGDVRSWTNHDRKRHPNCTYRPPSTYRTEEAAQ